MNSSTPTLHAGTKRAASPRAAGHQGAPHKGKASGRRPEVSPEPPVEVGVARSEGAPHRAWDKLASRLKERTAELAKVKRDLRAQVAERLRVEEALQESQQRYRLIAEHPLDLTKLLDLEGNVLYASPSHYQVLGYTQEDLRAANFFKVVHPDCLRQVRSTFRELISTHRNQTVELRLRKKTGHWIDLEVILAPIEDDSGAVGGVLLSGRDMTQRKRAEEALKEANQFREKVMECARDAIGAVDLEGNLTLVNSRVTEITGYRREELIGRPFYFLLPAKDLGRVREVVKKTLTEGVPVSNFETELVRKDGATRIISFSLVPLYLEGTISGAVGTAEDITERKRADQALRETEDLHRDLLENSGMLFGTHDAEGRILSAIGPVVRLVGFERPEELIGYKVSDFLAPEVRDKFDSYLETVFKEGRAHGYMKVMTRSGDARVIEYNNSLRREGLEEPIVRCIGLDVTERMRAEKALKASEERYRQLSGRLLQLRDEESRRIARDLHDTIGPGLAALVANLAVLGKLRSGLGKKAREAASESLALAKQCARDLRTVSYLLHPPLLDEMGLASALRWYVDGFARRSGINVQLEVAPELDRLPQEMETTLFRIVQESLTNIHLHSGSSTASIRVARSATRVELEVRDEGRGMAADVLRGAGGSVAVLGVGIAGMRERVKQLGGRLEVSCRSKGTTVRADLPLCRAPQRPASTRP